MSSTTILRPITHGPFAPTARRLALAATALAALGAGGLAHAPGAHATPCTLDRPCVLAPLRTFGPEPCLCPRAPHLALDRRLDALAAVALNPQPLPPHLAVRAAQTS